MAKKQRDKNLVYDGVFFLPSKQIDNFRRENPLINMSKYARAAIEEKIERDSKKSNTGDK